MAKTPSLEVPTDDEYVDVDINDATHQQLLWFSRTQQNLDVDLAETPNQTLARLRGAYPHPTIKVPRIIEEAVKPTTAPLTADTTTTAEERYGLPEIVYVQAHGDGDDAEEVIKFAHNGKAYVLKVGEVVPLPWYVYQGCFVDSKEIRYSVGRDAGLGPARVVQGVSFTRVR